MKRSYLHGDIADPSEFSDGVDTERFYDSRLGQFILVDWETTIASHDDLFLLKQQLKGMTPASRPFGTRNVFSSNGQMGLQLRRRRSRHHGERELAALERRRAANEVLMKQNLCVNCGFGRLRHAEGKCLFDSTDWAPSE